MHRNTIIVIESIIGGRYALYPYLKSPIDKYNTTPNSYTKYKQVSIGKTIPRLRTKNIVTKSNIQGLYKKHCGNIK